MHQESHVGRKISTADTKQDHIPSLPSVATAEEKPGGWALTVVHTSGELKFAVIRVVPGREASKHHHREAVGLLRATPGRRCHRGYDRVGRGRRIPHEYAVS
jgi:hypothetical protein